MNPPFSIQFVAGLNDTFFPTKSTALTHATWSVCACRSMSPNGIHHRQFRNQAADSRNRVDILNV